MSVRAIIPSMFHRRIALLLSLVAVGFCVLAARIYALGVIRGPELRADAERALVTQRWTPTIRGRILDRKGRVLAQDRPAFDVAIDFEVLSGEWTRKQAAREARAADRRRWADLGREGRAALTDETLPIIEARLDDAWAELARIASVPVADLLQRRDAIVADVTRQALHQWRRAQAEREELLSRKAGRHVPVSIESVKRPIREQKQPHVILRDVPDTVAFALRRFAPDMPGLRLLDPASREYPLETMTVRVDRRAFPPPLLLLDPAESRPVVVRGVATHIIGWMRSRIFAEDVAARPFRNAQGEIDRGAYREGDSVGQSGIELGLESRLRGLRGRTTLHLDTGQRDELASDPGHDIRLTIDANLQARIHALMIPDLGLARVQPWHLGSGAGQTILPIGTPLNGAAVVIDVDSAEILAMVSTPSFTREDLQTSSDAIFRDRVDAPWVNRCVQAPYPPGSIVKAPLLAGAATSGAHDLSRAIDCTGHLYPDRPDIFRCWRFKQFNSTHTDQLGHPLSAEDALCVSCNIFFYTVGRELGPEGIETWFKRYGVGSTWNLGLGDTVEHPGLLGIGARRAQSGAISKSDAIHMAIGQGPVAWTPLHAADAYATLARRGLRMTPRLTTDAEVSADDLRLAPAAVDAALEGLRRSVNDALGTGHHLVFDGVQVPMFNVPGVSVWGKTGTAEAPDIRIDPDGAGPLPLETAREGDHSWYVALVGPEGGRPKFSIAVIMEYAGSGGRVSGPIINEIVRALAAEGYLPAPPDAPAREDAPSEPGA